ncbi:hypothetical protein AAG906_021547 [Vitis piasezkii]
MLTMGTKENKMGGGTIILECGPNYLVDVDVPYDASTPLPIPIPGQTTLVGLQLASKKGKKETVNEVEVKSKSEKPQDVKNFEALVGLMLATSRAQPIDFPNDVFGESFKTFLMKQDMDMIISSKECPRQPGSVECGYYVIRYMKEIIANPNQLTTKFDGRKSFNEMEINEVRSDWIMLMTQLIITHA